MSSRTVRATQRNPVSKNKNKQTNKQKTLNEKNKERILKSARENGQVTYKGRIIRIIPNVSAETLKAGRAWTEVMQTLREQKCQSRLLYPAKLSINIDGKTKIFQDKTIFKQYLSTNPAQQRILEGKLQHKEGTCTKERTRY